MLIKLSVCSRDKNAGRNQKIKFHIILKWILKKEDEIRETEVIWLVVEKNWQPVINI